MVGVRNIRVNKAFTLEELGQFMVDHWERSLYNGFFGAKASALSKPSIILPATPRYMVLVAPNTNRKGQHTISLGTVEMNASLRAGYKQSGAMKTPVFEHIDFEKRMTAGREKKGPAEEVLQIYTDYLTKLLGEHGYLE